MRQNKKTSLLVTALLVRLLHPHYASSHPLGSALPLSWDPLVRLLCGEPTSGSAAAPPCGSRLSRLNAMDAWMRSVSGCWGGGKRGSLLHNWIECNGRGVRVSVV
jgi:hypothetical protein